MIVSNDDLGHCLEGIFKHSRRSSMFGNYQAVAFETISYPWSFGHPRDDLNESRYGGESLTIILALVKLESSKGYMLAAGPCFQQTEPTKPMLLKRFGILGRMDIQETVSLNQYMGENLQRSSWPLPRSNLPRATCSPPVLASNNRHLPSRWF